MPHKLSHFLPVTALFLLGFAITAIAQQPDSTKTRRQAISSGESTEEHRTTLNDNRILIDSIKKHRDSTRVLFFYNDLEKLGALNLHQNDTTLAGFQNYDLLYKHDRFYATLGNIGQAYRSLVPLSSAGNSGFDYGIHSFDQYLYQNDSVKYYKVYKTYSELSYIQGAKKEQNFHAIFSRNIYRSINLGFEFRVMSAPGAYYRQKTNHINFVLTAQYFTKNQRYGVITNFTLNRLKNYENGGLTNDSSFVKNLESNRMVIPVNLASAQTRIRESGFFMKHYFNLSSHPKNEHDSIITSRHRLDLGRLSYSFQYNRQIQNFINNQPDSAFFPPPVLDTLVTIDSVTVIKIINDVVWSNPSFKPDQKPRIFHLEAGIRQQYSEVSLHGSKHFIRQVIPHAEIDFTPFQSIRLEARGDYVLGDYNQNDKSLRIKLSTWLGSQSKNGGIISITAHYSLQQPGWFYSHYLGNNYQWDTTWHKQSTISTGFNYSFRFFETGVNFKRIKNFIYLDSVSQPHQFQPEFGYFNLYLNTNANLWRFKFRAQLIYQTVQGTTVLKIPAFMGNLAIYYTQPLFSGAAILQPGLNFFYNTSYYADNYNPATRSFYLQDRQEIGNYVYMDVFINLKIQRARFFVTYTHLNASFMGRSYYTTPGYPMQDGAFKFGIAWRFHD
ncbi:MAG: putative porin [Bacteroidales bacterium]